MDTTPHALSRLTEATAGLVAADRSGWSGAARSDLLLALLGAREQIDATLLAVAGEWDAAVSHRAGEPRAALPPPSRQGPPRQPRPSGRAALSSTMQDESGCWDPNSGPSVAQTDARLRARYSLPKVRRRNPSA